MRSSLRQAAKMANNLTDLERAVLYERKTERPFSGKYNTFFPQSESEKRGHFACKGCANPLFPAAAKFNAGCGWPAFDKCFAGGVETAPDGSRTEIVCANCKGHLGHVFFGEGFTPAGQRHCVNSVSIAFCEDSVNTKDLIAGTVERPSGE